MGTGTLTIYSASAGSGKTHKLAGIYLNSLFRSKYSYRNILAVTFTNRATSEMKSRILEQLEKLASGEYSDYLPELIDKTGRNESLIRQEAGEILFLILHDYSRFSVCTIDTFYQKILRAFAREAGLYSGFSIELDHQVILSSAVDEMISSAADDKKLLEWLKSYTYANLGEDRNWNLKDGIMKLASELFRERFRLLSEVAKTKLEDKEFLLDYIRRIKQLSVTFEKRLLETGKRCTAIISEYGLTEDMFFRKSQGIPSFIRNLVSGVIKEPNSYVREILNDPPRLASDKMSPQLQKAADAGLERELKEALNYYDSNIQVYRSAEVVLENIYALGILTDVLNKVRQITASGNSFLLSDAGHVLNMIIREEQTPFIYEKTGNRYGNFMIDEFQDTSIIQWENFKPLISNSMSEGFDNLVVGDVKQSIYRWRNSDWKILAGMQKDLVDNVRFFSENLTINWRSRSNIIRFNNSLFTIVPCHIDQKLSGELPQESFVQLFSGAVQEDPGNNSGGYVKIEFISDIKDAAVANTGISGKKVSGKWNMIVLDRLPEVIEMFQDKGYSASDIGILVRDWKEGASVLKRMIGYSNSCPEEKKTKYNYNIVSGDSLVLSGSHAVNFLIAVITVLNDPDDMIARALMVRLYLLATGSEIAGLESLDHDMLSERSVDYFPVGYKEFLDNIRYRPLFRITEDIVSFFGLGSYSWNVAYLTSFQDLVMSFSGSMNAGMQAFLDWWETTGQFKSVVLPGNQDASRVLTIHKAKGLEFRVVILPFLSWDLDHKSTMQPFLWVTPGIEPFSELGIVPVKYSKSLSGTIFKNDYLEEKFSVYLDNINLLYVAVTRAKEALYGFAPADNDRDSCIAGVIRDAFVGNDQITIPGTVCLNDYFDSGKNIFEFGRLEERERREKRKTDITLPEYPVHFGMKSLNLRLHGENYFSAAGRERNEKINYGNLMHEIFGRIKTSDDVKKAIGLLVNEGKISASEYADIEKRVSDLISSPQVSEWFHQGNTVLTESEILSPSGYTRRPDRVILRDDRTIVVDFKFGEENPQHIRQVAQYRALLSEMGHDHIESFIWYVDRNKIVSV